MYCKKHLFTIPEKKHFLNIIKKYTNIIESNSSTLKIKKEVWNKITVEYNASAPASRQVSQKQLRQLRCNLKQKHKELFMERQRRLGNREGSATSDPDVSVVSPAPMVGIETVIDSDSSQDDLPATPIAEPQETDIPIKEELRESCSPPLLVCSGSLIPSAETQTMTAKLNTIEREYQDRQQRAYEKHEIEMRILREQLREAKAKADLAQLAFIHKKNMQDPFDEF